MAVRLGRQHVCNGVLSVVQQKTGQDVHIPLHDDLKVLLDARSLSMTFLVTAQGKPFTPAGFMNWFRDMVREAKLPMVYPRTGCARQRAAGLQKRAARRTRSWQFPAIDRLPR